MQTIAEAKRYLAENASGYKGARCPVCDKVTNVQKINMSAYLARCMIVLYRFQKDNNGWFRGNDAFLKLAPHLLTTRQHAQLALWGLIEVNRIRGKSAHGSTVQMIRLTTRGIQFVECKLKVPKTVFRYSGHKIEPKSVTVPMIVIDQALEICNGKTVVKKYDRNKLLKHGEDSDR